MKKVPMMYETLILQQMKTLIKKHFNDMIRKIFVMKAKLQSLCLISQIKIEKFLTILNKYMNKYYLRYPRI